MKLRLMAAIAFAAALYSCDDSTSGVGDFVSGIDKIDAFSDKYDATSATAKQENVYARTNKAYLGKYTDPDFGVYTAGFITQINCPDNFEFPEGDNLEIQNTDLEFTYTSFYGDSLANLTLQVDTLSRVIGDEKYEEEDKDLYYTSFNPEKYYDTNAKFKVCKTYAVADHALSDSVKNGKKFYYHTIDLGEGFSKHILDTYIERKDYFKDSYTFIRNVLKGFYVHVVQGDGSVIYIDDISLTMRIKYDTKTTAGKDTTIYAYTRFSASKEVLTATKMQNDESKLDELISEGGHTYIKTPAGLYTEIELPIGDMYKEHKNDTLNSVTMSIKKYRYAGTSGDRNEDAAYGLGVPQNLLMVRKDDYEDFFEKNKIYDDKTSFLATYDSNRNSYSFSKLNRLISHIFSEMREAEKSGKQLSDNWNKVLLVPVTTDVDAQSNNAVIGISNDLSVSAARLFGGTDGKNNPNPDEKNIIKMEVTYTNP